MNNCCNNKKTIRKDEDKNKLISRLHRINGQINGIEKMINEDRYCGDILIQLSAVNSGIKSLANLMLEKHINTCVVNDIKNNNLDVINELVDMIKRFQ